MTIPADLLAGYRRFRAGRYQQEVARYLSLEKDQAPKTMIIGCADSRVDPATIFSAGPGELFVVRNVAALAPPYEETRGFHGTSAAVEYAVEHLGVSNIVVMGHSYCGGVKAALDAINEQPLGRFIRPWVELLADARDRMLADPDCPQDEARRLYMLESLAVIVSIRNLEGFPFVRRAIDDRRIRLHGARFSVAAGELEWLDPDDQRFTRVTEG